jgi:hypothetical protein
MSDLLKGVLLALAAVAVLLFAAQAVEAVPLEHEQSWTEAVHNGLIEGNPAYYYNGQATDAEYRHAFITAANQLKAEQWVPVPWRVQQANGGSIMDVASFCPQYVWEYRDTSGDAYWPQLFADDHHRYDALIMFDDFWDPVVYLNPSAGRAYEHPAGGYHRLIVCWTDQ